MQDQKDERLWRMAKKRAAFKKSFTSYIVVNAFLWAIWWFTAGRRGVNMYWPWPIWPMLGWGIGLGLQYFEAYNGDRETIAEKEYEKLRRQQEKQ